MNLRAEFEHQDAEQWEQEHMAAEKEKQKEAETAECAQCVADDALNWDLAGCPMSYKKDDLRALAIALSISDKCTNSELLSRIEDCFKTNTNLKNDSRFSGLFSKRHKLEVTGVQEDTPNQGGSQSQQHSRNLDFWHNHSISWSTGTSSTTVFSPPSSSHLLHAGPQRYYIPQSHAAGSHLSPEASS